VNSDFKNKTLKTYQTIAADYSRANFKPFWVNEFETYKKLLTGKKIIDIGCGAGRDAVVFTHAGYEYTGIDASPAMLSIAKERAPKGIYRAMDFSRLDFPDSTFDGFWAAASFLHVPKEDVTQLLVEAKRITKPGGVGFISLKQKERMDEGMIEQQRFGGTISRYFSFYEKDEFKKYIADAGLRLLDDSTYIEDDERHTVWLGFFVKKP
jgi:ubiquinone/menaquinone biosynthesis C-methylase UbiE